MISSQLRNPRGNLSSRFRWRAAGLLHREQTASSNRSQRRHNQALEANAIVDRGESVRSSTSATRRRRRPPPSPSSTDTPPSVVRATQKSRDSTRCTAWGNFNHSPLRERLGNKIFNSTGAHVRRSVRRLSARILTSRAAPARKTTTMASNCLQPRTCSPPFYRVFVL